MTLCFDEAYEALKKEHISDEEYLHHVLAHFRGIRHSADQIARRPWEFMINDPVGNALREASLTSRNPKTNRVNVLEKLFASVQKDDATSVKDIVSKLGGTADSIPLQAIATFAALHHHVAVLRLCLQLGASLADHNTSMALDFATRTSELLDLLFQNDWRSMRTSRSAFNRMFEWSLHAGSEELTWFLEHGAIIDKDLIRRAVRNGTPIKPSCVDLLIHRYGVNLLKGTRLLQSAAKRGRNDTIKLVLDAGMDVNEMIPRSTYNEGEVELTALYEAVYKQHEDTVRLLLAHGADPYLEVGTGDLNTPMRLAEKHGYHSILGMLQRHMEKHQKSGRSGTSRL